MHETRRCHGSKCTFPLMQAILVQLHACMHACMQLICAASLPCCMPIGEGKRPPFHSLQERLGLNAAQRAQLAQAHAQLLEQLHAISAERLHVAATIKVSAFPWTATATPQCQDP